MIHESEEYSDEDGPVQDAERKCLKENIGSRGSLIYAPLQLNKYQPVSNTQRMRCILTALLPSAFTHSRKHKTKQTIH